jgi:GNAT superfamily N-acetyltransferase
MSSATLLGTPTHRRKLYLSHPLRNPRSMEIETADITSLDERQLAALEVLMAKAFADEPTDLLHLEIQRASDPRLGRGLVATRDGHVVGAVLSRQPRAQSVFVVYVAVASALRRRGLARWLLDQLAVPVVNGWNSSSMKATLPQPGSIEPVGWSRSRARHRKDSDGGPASGSLTKTDSSLAPQRHGDRARVARAGR